MDMNTEHYVQRRYGARNAIGFMILEERKGEQKRFFYMYLGCLLDGVLQVFFDFRHKRATEQERCSNS